MAQKNINIGSSANKGDGDPIRTAFSKTQDNFTDLYSRLIVVESATGTGNPGGATIQQSIIGDVIGQDSTLIIDSNNSTVNATTVNSQNITGNFKGSVVADDSTVLIDGVNGTISAGALTGSLPAIDGSALTGITATTLNGQAASHYLDFANFTNTPTTLAGYGITDSLQLGTSATTALAGNTALFSGAYADLTGKPTLFSGAFADLTSKPTTLAGYGITDAATLNNMAPTGAVDFTGATSVDFTGATISGTSFLTSVPAQSFASLTGKPTTLAGYGITDAANTSAETTFTADVKFDTGVEEKFATLTGSTGVVAHDCDNGHVFYHTGAAGDITANFTNLGLTAEYATNLTVIINQGATPYEVTAVQIGGAAQTINWQGGSAPTGNANGIDSFSFTILNDGGSFVVLGQMVDFT
tara:strand:- start:383 stop:1624 length:1242 start_codon:yes stop_codon:yes gene_type:complete